MNLKEVIKELKNANTIGVVKGRLKSLCSRGEIHDFCAFERTQGTIDVAVQLKADKEFFYCFSAGREKKV